MTERLPLLPPDESFKYRDLLEQNAPSEFDLKMPNYGETPVVMEIKLFDDSLNLENDSGKDIIQIIDLRRATVNKDGTKSMDGVSLDPSLSFLIVLKDVDFDARFGYKGLRLGEKPVVLGRSDRNSNDKDYTKSRFNFSRNVSRDHLKIEVSINGLILTDLNSTNGTTIFHDEYKKRTQQTPKIKPDWSYTAGFKGYLKNNEKDEKTFKGRNIIGRDSPIDGGVYTGLYGGEAIVVDSKKYPEGFTRLMSEVKKGITDEAGNINKYLALKAVFNTVRKEMKYSQEGVNEILNEIASREGRDEIANLTKVSLESFILAGKGVCRHQALTAGLLLEKLKEEGIINGEISVDRNKNWNPMENEYSGHAWVRYTTSSGQIVIMDIAQNYLGRLEDSEGSKHGWDYMRPEDKK